MIPGGLGTALLIGVALPSVCLLVVVAAVTLQRRLDARYRAATTDVCGDPCDECDRNDELVRAAFAAVDAEEARLLREFDEAIAAVADVVPAWHPEQLPVPDTYAGCPCGECDEAVADLDLWEIELSNVDGQEATA